MSKFFIPEKRVVMPIVKQGKREVNAGAFFQKMGRYEKDKKFFLFDFDGVLSPTGGVIRPEIGNELKKFKSNNDLCIGIVSSRDMKQLKGFASILGMENLLLCAEDGIHISMPLKNAEIIFTSPNISKQLLVMRKQLLSIFKKEISFFNAQYSIQAYPKVNFHPSEIHYEMTKIIEKNGLKELTAAFMNGHAEVVPNGVNKSTIARVLERMGADLNNIAHVGDDVNDLPLFEIVRGITFDNCEKIVQDAAKVVVQNVHSVFTILNFFAS
ncbi:MAG: HAD-IIB family hydrolase [Candidatus Micrarchaeota archaeon]